MVARMPPIPLRSLFRSRWAALAWAGGICWMAISYAGGGDTSLDATNASDGNGAALSALLAEDD